MRPIRYNRSGLSSRYYLCQIVFLIHSGYIALNTTWIGCKCKSFVRDLRGNFSEYDHRHNKDSRECSKSGKGRCSLSSFAISISFSFPLCSYHLFTSFANLKQYLHQISVIEHSYNLIFCRDNRELVYPVSYHPKRASARL